MIISDAHYTFKNFLMATTHILLQLKRKKVRPPFRATIVAPSVRPSPCDTVRPNLLRRSASWCDHLPAIELEGKS